MGVRYSDKPDQTFGRAVAAAVAGGLTYAQAAEKFGISPDDVWWSCRSAGMEPRHAKTRWRYEGVVKAFTGGMDIKEVAQKYGIGIVRAYGICHAAGIDVVQVSKERRRRRREAIVKAAVAGRMTIEAAARKFGLSESSIYNMCRAAGVKLEYEWRRLRRKQLQAVVDAVKSGKTIVEAAKKCEVSRGYVQKVCYTTGVVPQFGRKRSCNPFIVLKLLLEKKKQGDIADQFRVTRQYISLLAGQAKAAGFKVGRI